MSGRPLVVYHADCHDGFCAAWVLSKLYPDAEFLPAKYGDPRPKAPGRKVVIADFSYPRAATLELVAEASEVVVLDHHKTAEEALRRLADEAERLYGLPRPTVVFDMTKSGARLAWEYSGSIASARGRADGFFCVYDERTGKQIQLPSPWLVDFTEDRDLWSWKLPDSKAVNSCLRSYPLDFKVWDGLAEASTTATGYEQSSWQRDSAYQWQAIVAGGKAVLRAEGQLVAKHVAEAFETTVRGHKVLAVNATCLVSEIAGELAKDLPFGCCFQILPDGSQKWSLRSREGGADVSEVAKSFPGGGGHRNAAGFTVGPGVSVA